jgi:hypothetical protein
MPFSDLLDSLKVNARSPDIIRGLTGLTQDELNNELVAGNAPIPDDPGNTSAPLHSLTNKLMAQRFGSEIPAALGVGNEILPGLSNLSEGKPFFTNKGEEGFSLADLRSNFIGQRAGTDKVGGLSNLVGGAAAFAEPESGPSAGEILGTAASGIGPFLKDLFSRNPDQRGTTQITRPTGTAGFIQG